MDHRCRFHPGTKHWPFGRSPGQRYRICTKLDGSVTAFLSSEQLPKDKKEAHKLRNKALRYYLDPQGKLYKKSLSSPYLECVHPDKVEELLTEIHEGGCGAHSGKRSLAHRAVTQGYYWPPMRVDDECYVKKCEQCQKFSPLTYFPVEELSSITSPWPFAQWGLDITLGISSHCRPIIPLCYSSMS